jgi:hypothetical protein
MAVKVSYGRQRKSGFFFVSALISSTSECIYFFTSHRTDSIPVTSSVSALVSSVFPLVSSVFPLISSIFPLISSVFPLISSIFPLISSVFPLFSSASAVDSSLPLRPPHYLTPSLNLPARQIFNARHCRFSRKAGFGFAELHFIPVPHFVRQAPCLPLFFPVAARRTPFDRRNFL